jgi:hypothetical protein
VTIYLQHESPGPDKEANWLPAPAGPFYLVLRLYGLKAQVLADQWHVWSKNSIDSREQSMRPRD